MKLVKADKIPQAKNTNITNLPELLRFAKELRDFCISKKGQAIAAVQVGVAKRFYVVVLDKTRWIAYINANYEPIIDVSKKITTIEGCLSLGKTLYRVPRWDKIRLDGYTLTEIDGKIKFQQIDEVIDGQFAIVAQHELEHEMGILISEVGEEVIGEK